MAAAHVESKAGEKCNSPEDGRPGADRGTKESSYDDGEEEGRIGGKQNSGSASESEHGDKVDGGAFGALISRKRLLARSNRGSRESGGSTSSLDEL
jgi:hypothetical protein